MPPVNTRQHGLIHLYTTIIYFIKILIFSYTVFVYRISYIVSHPNFGTGTINQRKICTTVPDTCTRSIPPDIGIWDVQVPGYQVPGTATQRSMECGRVDSELRVHKYYRIVLQY